MQLRILSRNGELDRDMRRAIERKVRLVVGRYAAVVVRLQIMLGRSGERAASGPHQCRIHVDLGHEEGLTCVADDVDPVAAAAAAAWRIHRRLRQRPDRSYGPP